MSLTADRFAVCEGGLLILAALCANGGLSRCTAGPHFTPRPQEETRMKGCHSGHRLAGQVVRVVGLVIPTLEIEHWTLPDF